MAENLTASYQPEDLEKLSKIFAEILQSRCWEELTASNITAEDKQKSSEDNMAVVYIILVLLLFGTSLLILLIKYVRKEKESLRLQRFYDEYMDRRFPSMVVHYDDEGRYLKPKTSRVRRTSLDLDLPSPSVSSVVVTPTSTPGASPLFTPEASTTNNYYPLRKEQLEQFV